MPVGDNELDELYQEVLLDHYRSPRNRGSLPQPTATQEGTNPVCGDAVRIYVAIEGDSLRDIKFEGRGCSISQSAASLMTEAVIGKTVDEAKRLIDTFTAAMRGADFDSDDLGDLEALTGVRKFPVRVKCATLAWHTLEEALETLRQGEA